MKTLIALSALTLASATIAQAPAHTGNRVYTNNDPYYVICTCTNVNTGRNRQWMGTMHPQYEANGGSVPAGDLEFKIIKGHEYKRGDAGLAAPDQPMIVGWEAVVRQSASQRDRLRPALFERRIIEKRKGLAAQDFVRPRRSLGAVDEVNANLACLDRSQHRLEPF